MANAPAPSVGKTQTFRRSWAGSHTRRLCQMAAATPNAITNPPIPRKNRLNSSRPRSRDAPPMPKRTSTNGPTQQLVATSPENSPSSVTPLTRVLRNPDQKGMRRVRRASSQNGPSWQAWHEARVPTRDVPHSPVPSADWPASDWLGRIRLSVCASCGRRVSSAGVGTASWKLSSAPRRSRCKLQHIRLK